MIEKLRFRKLEILVEAWAAFLLANIVEEKFWKIAFYFLALAGFITSWVVARRINRLERGE